MNKLVFLVVVLAMVAAATAQWAHTGGAKDWAGNYYDYTTGQLSSATTGKVYNTGAYGAYGAYGTYGALPLPYAHHPGLYW